METASRINYVLIDFENTQPANLKPLDADPFRVFVFCGEKQTKVGLDLAIALQPLGARAEYVRISGTGPNAVDFHIAYFIGRLAERDPHGYFHIISRDTGFDPLVHYLHSVEVHAARRLEITDIPLLKASNAGTPEDKFAIVVDALRRRAQSRPRTVKTLTGTIHATFQKKLSEAEASAIIHSLKARGIIKVNELKVTYMLPSEGEMPKR